VQNLPPPSKSYNFCVRVFLHEFKLFFFQQCFLETKLCNDGVKQNKHTIKSNTTIIRLKLQPKQYYGKNKNVHTIR
jgi:hypothetical protein